MYEGMDDMQNSSRKDIFSDTEETAVKSNTEKRFASKGYEQFYHEMLKKSGINEIYHRSFLLYGISDIVMTNIGRELPVNNHDVQRK